MLMLLLQLLRGRMLGKFQRQQAAAGGRWHLYAVYSALQGWDQLLRAGDLRREVAVRFGEQGWEVLQASAELQLSLCTMCAL